MKRRDFLVASSAALLSPHLAYADGPPRRVAVIGHTGRGDYGHGIDTVWRQIPTTEIAAVADPVASGLAKAMNKLKVDRGFAEYRKMLREVRPEFVAVGPRHIDQHCDMILAAIESGAKGIYCEKPFCRTPAEADQLIAACEKHGAKIAVAHRNRYHPALPQIDALIESGRLGKLLEMRGRGVGDHRGGDEDLWVLGSHVLNLAHHFAGAPQSCSAIMLNQGRRVVESDVKPGAEGLGPLAADEVHARYETEKGVIAYYDSIANDGTNRRAYCLQLIGDQAMVTIFIDRNPLAYFTPGNPYQTDPSQKPLPITTAGVGKPETQPDLIRQTANHVLAVQDLIDACDQDRQPACSGRDGAVTVEMICGVFASHAAGGQTLDFPLQERDNALATW
ncbi:MAG: Gfo/Idh/MocA family protein [Blastopirellula sp. JB062]